MRREEEDEEVVEEEKEEQQQQEEKEEEMNGLCYQLQFSPERGNTLPRVCFPKFASLVHRSRGNEGSIIAEQGT